MYSAQRASQRDTPSRIWRLIGGWRMAVIGQQARDTAHSLQQSLHQHQNIKKYLCHFIIHKKTSVPTRYHRDTQIRTCCPPWTWRLWSGLCAIIITASAPLLLRMEWTRVWRYCDPRHRSMAVHGAPTTHGSPHPNLRYAFIISHYWLLFFYPYVPAVARQWQFISPVFFFNNSGHGMVIVLFSLFLFVYAEGKAHGRESTAFFVQAVHNPRTAVYVAYQFARKISVVAPSTPTARCWYMWWSMYFSYYFLFVYAAL